jgi:hypothetical protein
MNVQLERNCPECFNDLLWIKCEARAYRYVVEDNGAHYSIWEHSGSHKSHPRPPVGRRPPHSVPMPLVKHGNMNPQPADKNVSKSKQCSGTATRAQSAKTVAAQGLFYPVPISTHY